MVKIFKTILVCSISILAMTSCSEAGSASVLHVHYVGQDNMNTLYMYKPGCDEYYRENLIPHEWKIYGDESLLGRSVGDEYWSRDGAYHVSYTMSYGVAGYGENVCQYQVVPKLEAEYENFITQTKTKYKRTYQGWNDSAGQGVWSELERFKTRELSDSGDVKKESWGVKKILPNTASNRKLAELMKDTFVGEPKNVGKELVAGKSCDLVIPLAKWSNGGIENHTCSWDPEDPNLPDSIILKVTMNVGDVGGSEKIAERIEEHAQVPSSILLPPVEWQHKEEGSYTKSKKTNHEWVDRKPQAKSKKQKPANQQKETQALQKKLLEKLKKNGLSD